MATVSATSTISHSLPPMSMTSAPRVRPPRIPKGTPNANTNPQPPGEVPPGKVWVQGKWRERSSNAARDRRLVQARRIEKALRHENHGANIYAYNHIQTHQVVYSLTRTLEHNKIMSQLIYHGKKTVPAALRRDMWTPYFSLHFPSTEAGAASGLIAYQQLRELSLQRQLQPPDEMVIATEEDLENASKKMDPIRKEKLKRDKQLKLPIPGQLLPRKTRARRLMDQKATSVADVACVLGVMDQGPSPEEMMKAREEKRKERFASMGRRAKYRFGKIRQEEAKASARVEEARRLPEEMQENKGLLHLPRSTAQRINLERRVVGLASGPLELRHDRTSDQIKIVDQEENVVTSFPPGEAEATRGAVLSSTSTASEAEASDEPVPSDQPTMSDVEPLKVKILWADMRDGTYAESWPGNVVHDELDRGTVSRAEKALKVKIDDEADPQTPDETAVDLELSTELQNVVQDIETRAARSKVTDVQGKKTVLIRQFEEIHRRMRLGRDRKNLRELKRLREAARKGRLELFGDDGPLRLLTADVEGKQEQGDADPAHSESEDLAKQAYRLKEQGIEVQMPTVGWLDRLKALFRRR